MFPAIIRNPHLQESNSMNAQIAELNQRVDDLTALLKDHILPRYEALKNENALLKEQISSSSGIQIEQITPITEKINSVIDPLTKLMS